MLRGTENLKHVSNLLLSAFTFSELTTHQNVKEVLSPQKIIVFPIGEKLLDSCVVRNLMFVKNPGSNMVYSEP